MAIRTFRGKSAADALGQVKRSLGSDAVILHTRTERTGGLMGFGRTTVFEITATSAEHYRRSKSPGAPSRRPTPSARPAPRAPESAPDTSGHSIRSAVAEVAKIATSAGGGDGDAPGAVGPPPDEHSGPADSLFAPEPHFDPFEDRVVRAPRSQDAPAPRRIPDLLDELDETRDAPAPTTPRISSGDADLVSSELAELRKMVSHVLASQRRSADAAGRLPAPLMQAYLALIDAEVDADIADALIGRVRDDLTAPELEDEHAVRRCLHRRLADVLPASGHVSTRERGTDDRPLTVALIGPTGVGKTTTLAKLAASYRLRRGWKVAMITCDTYRIAAVDQLRTYAGIIGCELRVVSSPADMPGACADLASNDVVLIDTAGRSPNDPARLEELRSLLRVASPHRSHLVLSATSGERAMRAAVAAFSRLRPDHVIFTKLDEADGLGVIANTMHTLDATASYVAIGQEVPDDLEPVTSDRLASLVLDGVAR